MELDGVNMSASFKRRHSGSEDVDREATVVTVVKKQKQESEEKSAECTTETGIKEQKPENEETSEECAAETDIKKQKQENNTSTCVTEIGEQKQESEEISEESVTEAKKQKQENEDTGEDCAAVMDINHRRQEHEETVMDNNHQRQEHEETYMGINQQRHEHEETGIDNNQQRHEHEETGMVVNKQGKEHEETGMGVDKQGQEHEETGMGVNKQGQEHEETGMGVDKQGQEHEETGMGISQQGQEHKETGMGVNKQGQEHEETGMGVDKQGQEHEETSEESQETTSADMETQTDVFEFILNEKEPIMQRLSSSWTSTVDYQRHISDTWCSVEVTRPLEAEPTTTIDVYNTDKNCERNIILERFQDQGALFYYHGTDEVSAKNIIERGIDLTVSTRCADFSKGNGFYVTRNYNSALKWSKQMVRRSGARAAVIAFKTDNDVRNYGILSLKVSDDTNKKWWQCIVSHFRRGENSPDIALVLKGVQAIEGPMAEYFHQAIPTPIEGGRLTHLCIRDQDLATRFGKLANIMGVVFVSL